MPLTRTLLFTFLWGVCCLSVGGLSAQQNPTSPREQAPARSTFKPRRAVNANVSQSAKSASQPTRTASKQQTLPISDQTYIAVIGAVKTPCVIETTERAVSLKRVIDRAGGETSDSIGMISLMDQAGQSRGLTQIDASLDKLITNGQVVFVALNGGKTPQSLDPRQPAPDNLVLISGLAPEPMLFNFGGEPHPLKDLLYSLGQPVEMIKSGDVCAIILPQGSAMGRESLLLRNTMIRFNPLAVDPEGIKMAEKSGLRCQPLAKLDAMPAEPTQLRVPATTAPAILKSNKPLNLSPAVPQKDAPAPPLTSNEAPEAPSFSSGIEAAGSSIPVDEPNRFPSEVDDPSSVEPVSPKRSNSGRMPILFPQGWQEAQGSEQDTQSEDSPEIIDRTSALIPKNPGRVVTASAEYAAASAHETSGRSPAPASVPEASTLVASPVSGPQSWTVLFIVAGVAASSVLVTRVLTSQQATRQDSTVATQSDADARNAETEASSSQKSIPEDERRFLQRLILNKVPVIEEEATLPTVERLHGMSVGGRRLVVHEARKGVSGPHFKVRDRSDTRELELKLRRLMRVDRSSKSTASPASELVHAGDTQGLSGPKHSPLERALRSVERGVTQ